MLTFQLELQNKHYLKFCRKFFLYRSMINQKLLTNVTDSIVSIKDYITGLKLNVINDNQDLSDITGILVFGKDDQNKSRTLLFNNNGNLVISSRFSEQTGLQILTKLLPLTFDDQNKLLVSADIGTVEIKDGNIKLNLIGKDSSILNLNGILVFGKDNQSNARLLLFDNQGYLLVSPVDTLDHYKISDIDDASDVKYYSFMDKDGNYYFLKEDTINKTYRYWKGSGNYSGDWTNRASKTCDLFCNVF